MTLRLWQILIVIVLLIVLGMNYAIRRHYREGPHYWVVTLYSADGPVVHSWSTWNEPTRSAGSVSLIDAETHLEVMLLGTAVIEEKRYSNP